MDDIHSLGDTADREARSQSEKSLVCKWEVPLIPLLERSCSDCGVGGGGAVGLGPDGTCRRKQGKFRRVLSETWNYPSWLFVESANNSSSDDVDLDPDRECEDAEIVVVECNPADGDIDQDDSDSEDEGWYSLSRTDVRKLQEVRNTGDRCDAVNIILTNPDILHLCTEEVEDDDDEEDDDDVERKQESSPERTSYSSLSSGDSGQVSDGSKLGPLGSAPGPGQSSRKSSDSGHSPGPDSCSCSSSSHDNNSSDISCDNEDSCTHKITVYVKYSENLDSNVPLVEGCVDSEGEQEISVSPETRTNNDTVVTCDNDTITICDTRVRLRLCARKSIGGSHRRKKLAGAGGAVSHIVPVKRKDLFKLLGLNETSDIVDPSEEADAKKVALQNFLCSSDKNDAVSKRSGGGILLAPKQGKKNLAKFLGIDMSALSDYDGVAGVAGSTTQGGAGLDCESVSISSSTTSGGGGRRSKILGMNIPGIRNHSRGASVEKTVMEDIPEQLRTPKVPQANRKDLQRFLGLNDSEEMVYIRNVRKPYSRHEHRVAGSIGPHGKAHSQDCTSGPSVSSGGTISSVCSCVVCTSEYSSGSVTSPSGPSNKHSIDHNQTAECGCDVPGGCTSCHTQLVETKCDNDKCIMCTPIPSSTSSLQEPKHKLKVTSHEDTAIVSENTTNAINNNNNYPKIHENKDAPITAAAGSRVPPPPLPKKTVAPYQEYKFGLEEPMPSMGDQEHEDDTIVSSAPAPGKDKRRKKQATKRMEQLIKIHTENTGEQASEGIDNVGDVGDDAIMEPNCDQHQNSQPQQLKIIRTLDRTDATGNTNRGRHRLHKRSILKHHSKEGDKSAREGGGPVKMDIRPTNMKVKFAGSLRKREQAKLNRRKMIGHPCQVHFPWHPDYLDMRHILAVVDPRYLTPLHK